MLTDMYEYLGFTALPHVRQLEFLLCPGGILINVQFCNYFLLLLPYFVVYVIFILPCDFHLFFPPPFHSPFISLFVSLCLFLNPPSNGYARVPYHYNSGLASSVFAETANSYSM